ncbi:helix-turn-helix domain-containing protein [Rhizobium puerariae]|uniref:Helix-turn-helix domain-containing protein n=1 Tax=Rhizobium puerariae TaxID=1585791 RepID=A0ABV6AEY3_9HYPH
MYRSTGSLTSVGSSFGLDDAPCRRATPIREAGFSATRLEREVPAGSSRDVVLDAMDAYFLMVYRRDVLHCDILSDGGRSPVRTYRKGSVCLVDLTAGASISLLSRLDSVAFVIPVALFRELAELSPGTRLHGLRCRRGEMDPIIEGLTESLLPALQDVTVSYLAFPHIALAICAHLIQNYSDMSLQNGLNESSLSVWQEKAAKEFMLDNLGTSISVTAIAASAGLSAGHFSHGFKRATGMTPHQWLLKMRVVRAKELLAESTFNIATIAEICGFSDQSYFTKVFARSTGMTPAAWRLTQHY